MKKGPILLLIFIGLLTFLNITGKKLLFTNIPFKLNSQVFAQSSPDWLTRQNYELTHASIWTDSRPTVARAIAGYEAHERGLTSPVHLPNEHSSWPYIPQVTTVAEANQIMQSVYDSVFDCPTSTQEIFFLPWSPGTDYGCGDGWSGMSAKHHTGIGLAYALAKYSYLMPQEIKDNLNELVVKLKWYDMPICYQYPSPSCYECDSQSGCSLREVTDPLRSKEEPYMTYSNIPIAGAVGMLLVGDYAYEDLSRGVTQARIQQLKDKGYDSFERFFNEIKYFGYFELASSYTDYQYYCLPAVYELARNPDTQAKARFMLDEFFLQLAHMYQPGSTPGTGYKKNSNTAGFHDREYGDTVQTRPNTYGLWLATGDPGGELKPSWLPYSIWIASGYSPPEYIKGIALKQTNTPTQITQTFWSGPTSRGAFPPPTETFNDYKNNWLVAEGGGRCYQVPHHVYMLKDGSLSLGGTISHLLSSNTGSHNLRIAFSKTDPPLAITHIDPERASSDVDYPLDVAFLYEQPSFKRLFYENIVLSVWDPMPEGFNYTNAFIPIQAVDETDYQPPWFFVRHQGSLAAYAVLADPQSGVDAEIKNGYSKGSGRYNGQFYYIRTPDGQLAGGIGEIASLDDYGSFDNFKQNIQSRTLSFNSSSQRLSYQTRDGKILVVQYSPEQYEIDGQISQRSAFAPQYFIQSPWAEHKIPTTTTGQNLTQVNWNNQTWTYNWNTLEIQGSQTTPPPPPPATSTPTPSPQSKADVNGDNIVNLGDIQGILFYWGQPCAGLEPACTADVNDDKLINIADIAGVIFYWGQTIP